MIADRLASGSRYKDCAVFQATLCLARRELRERTLYWEWRASNGAYQYSRIDMTKFNGHALL
jgi:hypothetical protein